MTDVFDTLVIMNHCRRDKEAKCHSNLKNRINVRVTLPQPNVLRL
jgi:hypothetical protein